MSYKDRVQRFSDDLSLAAEGEINPAQVALRAAGEGAGLVGDGIGAVVGAVLPDFVEEGIGQVIQGVMDTGPAKIALKWMEENPEHARDVVSLINVASLIPVNPVKGVGKLAQNAPNKLSNFYGGGKLGGIYDIASGAPTSVAHALNDTFNPKAAANYRAGVPSRLKAVAKETMEGPKVEQAFIRGEGGPEVPLRNLENDAAKYMEGQLDQTSLLRHGADQPAPFLDDTFRSVQELNVDKLSPESFKAGQRAYKPEQQMGPSLLDKYAEPLEQRVRKAQGMKGDAVHVTRHPTAFSDLATEATGGKKASDTAKGMYKARESIRELYPEKTSFKDVDEVAEFVAAKSLFDRKTTRADGKPLSKLDRTREKWIGKSEKWKDSGGPANVKTYYQLKRKFDDGPQFTDKEELAFAKLRSRVEAGETLPKTAQKKLERFEQRELYGELTPGQIEKFKGMRKKIHERKNKLKIDRENGVVYTQDTHRSAAKGLGGVNDQFAVDLQGNVINLISDENDLFGISIPFDKRVVSTAPPDRYNIFRDKPKITDADGVARKQALQENLAANYGAPARGTGKVELMTQQADAINQFQAPVQARDYLSAGGKAGLLGILAGRDEQN